MSAGTHKRLILRSTALAGLIGLAVAGHASAQAASAAKPDVGNTVGEVVVTAQKKAEFASRTPVALSAVTGEALKSSGVVAVSDIQNIVPSVVVGRDNFGVNISIRGVTSTDNTSKGDQGIAFNIDGIPIGRPVEEGLAFFDVNRVEVLRGPQGTLYGKSSTGGAINVITNLPQPGFAASANAEFGNYSARRGDVMVNLPVTDKFDVRFAANTNERDGFLDSTLGADPHGAAKNDQNDVSARLSGLYHFTDNVSLVVTLTGGHVGGIGSGQGVLQRVLHDSGEAQREVYGNPFGGAINDSFFNVNGEFNADLGFAHLTYDGAHLSFLQHDMTSSTNDPLGNYAGPPPAIAEYGWRDYHGDFQTDSHEVRLSNPSKGRIDWVVGANWYRENIHESDHNWDAVVSDPTYATSTNGIDPVNNTIHTSYGVFGQATIHLNEVFGIVLGVRDGHDSLTRAGTFAAGPFDVNGAICRPFADCIGGPNNGSESASKVTYRAGLNVQFTPTQLAYFSVATGYKAGGFNDFDPATHGAGVYAPESMTAYELGYKGRPISGLTFNSALFYYDYSSEQISSLENIQGNFVIYTRGTPTTIYGWENEATYRLTPEDVVTASLNFEKSKYDSFFTGLLGNVDFSGRSLDRTPSVVASLGYSHTWNLANGGSVAIHGDTKYSASYLLSDFVAGIQYTQGAFTRTNLNLTYTAPDGRFTTQLFVRNIEDNIQSTGGVGGTTAGAPEAASTAVSEPRMFGVRFGYKY